MWRDQRAPPAAVLRDRSRKVPIALLGRPGSSLRRLDRTSRGFSAPCVLRQAQDTGLRPAAGPHMPPVPTRKGRLPPPSLIPGPDPVPVRAMGSMIRAAGRVGISFREENWKRCAGTRAWPERGADFVHGRRVYGVAGGRRQHSGMGPRVKPEDDEWQEGWRQNAGAGALTRGGRRETCRDRWAVDG